MFSYWREIIKNRCTGKRHGERYWPPALRIGGSGVKGDTYSPAQFRPAYVQFLEQVFKVIRRHFLTRCVSQKCDTARALYRKFAIEDTP